MDSTADTKYPVPGSEPARTPVHYRTADIRQFFDGTSAAPAQPAATTAVTVTRGAGLVEANPRFPAIKPREANIATVGSAAAAAPIGTNASNVPTLTKDLNDEAKFNSWVKAEQLRRTISGVEPLRSAVQAVDSYRKWVQTQLPNTSEHESLIRTVGSKTELPSSTPVTTASENPSADNRTDASAAASTTASESSTKFTPPSEHLSDTARISSQTQSNSQAELDRLREISRLTQQISLTRSIQKTGGKGKRKVTWPDSKEPVVVSNGRVVSADPFANTGDDEGASDADESEGGDDTDADVDDIYEGLMARFDAIEQKVDVLAVAIGKVEKAFVDLAAMLGAKRI